MAAPLVALAGLGVGALATGAVFLGGLVGTLSLSGGAGTGAGPSGLVGQSAPSARASTDLPAPMLDLYRQAATACPGLDWTVLAAIGTVESDNGTSDLPGVHSGSNAAGAEGPMQFEPATFADYDEPVPPGGSNPPNPYDPTDAVYAAARDLCANGGGDVNDLGAAVYAYNHSEAYVSQVLDLAQSYAQAPAATAPAGTDGVIAVDWALAQIGTPYIWGAEDPGVGFDCSGLTQAAYQVAGIALPRVAQYQFDAGPALPPGTPLEPGDLVFFGDGPTDVQHVGIYVGDQGGQAVMVDAPSAGATVREDIFPNTVGAAYGELDYVGATRPDA